MIQLANQSLWDIDGKNSAPEIVDDITRILSVEPIACNVCLEDGAALVDVVVVVVVDDDDDVVFFVVVVVM